MKMLPDQLSRRSFTGRQIRLRTLGAFALLLLFFTVGWIGFNWVKKQPRDGGTPKPLRAVLNTNERIFSSFFDSAKKVKEYPVSAAVKNVRVNGDVGMDGDLDASTWRLQVVRHGGDTLRLTLDEI